MAVAERRAGHKRTAAEGWAPWIPPRGFEERMDRVGGLVTLAATPSVLRVYAAYIYTLGDWHQHGIATAEVD